MGEGLEYAVQVQQLRQQIYYFPVWKPRWKKSRDAFLQTMICSILVCKAANPNLGVHGTIHSRSHVKSRFIASAP
jgi:hypothetical protein